MSFLLKPLLLQLHTDGGGMRRLFSFVLMLSMHKSVNMIEGSPVIYSGAIGTRPLHWLCLC